jgi:anti-sigma B factor antagonist
MTKNVDQNSTADFTTREALDGEVIVIETPQFIDLHSAVPLRGILADLVAQGKVRVVVDMSETEYMDSIGLGALVSRIAAMRSGGGDLRLASPSSHTQKILELTNLAMIIDTFEDVNSAVESYIDA